MQSEFVVWVGLFGFGGRKKIQQGQGCGEISILVGMGTFSAEQFFI
jgi:hypothetical protein